MGIEAMDATEVGAGLMQRFLGRLRFPQLFTLAAILFFLDLLIPDLIPFADEIFLGLVSALLAGWKERGEPAAAKPPEKNVTPAPRR